MQPVKKILVLHGDATQRRRLVLLLADAGFDVRAYPDAAAAAENVRGEWFDLAVLDHDLSGGAGQTPVDQLKKLQPTLAILLVVPQLELPLVVQGIRLGVADVVALGTDVGPLLRRVRLLLGLGACAAAGEVTPQDLAQVDAVLARLPAPVDAKAEAVADDLLRLSRENAALGGRVERLQQEKAGLEAELKTLLAQGMDHHRLETELAELKSERELAAATQAAIDEKARGLGELRAAVAAERTALERARQGSGAPATMDGEREARLRRLEEEEDRVAGEAARLRQESTQIAQERRRWNEDLELLRAQEQNLRDYEARLRQVQAQLESDRVLWFSASARPVPPSPFANDAALKEAWTKLQRASELLEAERSNFRDDRLVMSERESTVKHREAQVRDREIKLALREKKLSELPPVAKKSAPVMSMAKLVLGRRAG